MVNSVKRPELVERPMTIRLLMFFCISEARLREYFCSLARENKHDEQTGNRGSLQSDRKQSKCTAAIAEAELFTSPGLDENTSRKKGAAVVNENHASIRHADTSTYAAAWPAQS
jgi:hypothetical protein